MSKQFQKIELDNINVADDLKIAPFRADGITIGTPTWIWAVVVDGDLYVRAYNGKIAVGINPQLDKKQGKFLPQIRTMMFFLNR